MIVRKLLETLEDSSNNFEDFKKEISEEIFKFKELKKKKGSSRPIYLSDYENLTLTKKHCIKLCTLYLSRLITSSEIDYIVSGLCLLNFREELIFEGGERLFDIIEELSDPDVNGELTKERVEFVLNQLEKLKKDSKK